MKMRKPPKPLGSTPGFFNPDGSIRRDEPEPERPKRKKKKLRVKEGPQRPYWRTKPEEGPPWD